MSDQSDNQNRCEEQEQLSEGTSPSSSYDEGSRSTPSNLPKAATRTRKKRTSDSEDEDYVAAEDEATSKKKVVKKEGIIRFMPLVVSHSYVLPLIPKSHRFCPSHFAPLMLLPFDRLTVSLKTS